MPGLSDSLGKCLISLDLTCEVKGFDYLILEDTYCPKIL